MEVASAHGIIKKGGSWLTWQGCPSGPLKLQGSEKLRAHLLENAADYSALRDSVVPLLGSGFAAQFVDEVEDEGVSSTANADLDAIFDESPASPVPDTDA